MKKKGLVSTLNGDFNFGNKLQNYAVLKLLEKYNIKAYNYWRLNFKLRLKRQIKALVRNNRESKFIKFSNEYIRNKFVISEKKYDLYDFYFTGSDQVWNYNLDGLDEKMFLKKKHFEKNIAISASFGVSEIPDDLKSKYINGINNIKYLSVRENDGKNIINQLTGRNDVEVLIDPTLMLSKKEWSKIIKKTDNEINKKFILCYFLGNISESIKEEINRVAEEHDCEIINILDPNDEFYNCGPSEFLYLEKKAFLVCTDSFHSCVFAFIFDRPFIVFEREDSYVKMNSRIDTLLNKLQIDSRKYNGKKITDSNLNHNYEKSYLLLNSEQEKMYNFLGHATKQEKKW